MSNAVWIVCAFTFLIHFAESSAYAIRLAGVRTRQVASSISFVNSMLLVSRLSNMFQAPLLGAMVDRAAGNDLLIPVLGSSFRWIIFAGFLGSGLGLVLLPALSELFTVAMRRFQDTASIPKVFISVLKPDQIKKIAIILFRRPRFGEGEAMTLREIPRTFLVMNVVMTAVYSLGVLAALYAGACAADIRATAIQLSGIVNGLATICLVLFVDPGAAHIVDGVVQGRRSVGQMWGVVVGLAVGRLIGVGILAQILFDPATNYIQWVARWVVRVF